MSEKEKIKKFVEKFFQNLGCDVSYEPSPENLEEKGILKIQNVPKRFAKFYGKEEPYYFYFNESENISNGEYVTKGSYILSCINKFLENKGETTLLKIKFEEKPRKIIEDRFTLRNCKISEISSKNEYEYLERFTFLTTFQYLNKKEEEITKLFVKSNNGEVIDFDISKYETEEGKKRDLKQLNFEKDYEAAKNKLKEKIQEKTNSLKQKLSENLEKEKQRIESHYIEQLKDDKKNLEKLKKQLDDLEPGEKNSKKIIKTREQIEELSSEERKKELEKDKNSSIKQEIQKHSLNIKNKLINTTIICSPIIQYRVYFKTPQNMKRLVNIEYNVLEDKISGVKCDVCQKELNEIILCSSGHLICRECGFRCEECGEILCKKCPTFKCPDCGKTVCKNCVKRCPVCRKTKCSNHFMKESFHKQEICKKCAEMCSDCGEFFSPENIRKTKSGKNLCEKCHHKSIKNNVLDSLR